MSVVLGNDVLASNRGPDAILKGHEGFGLVSFTAGLARSKGQGIVKKPLAEEPAHAEVFGKKTKAVQRELAKGCDWIVHMPDDVDVA